MRAIFDADAIRKGLDQSDWEDCAEDPSIEVRSTFLGTVFTLTPSGKFYTPIANSNVERCPRCHGHGSTPGHRKARVIKRAQKRMERTRTPRQQAKFGARRERYQGRLARGAPWLGFNYKLWQRHAHGITCTFCGGIGSREAYLDELWREQAAAELAALGYSLESGEGDPCDLFAAEYRDKYEPSHTACDECGRVIPVVEGGGLTNKHHDDSCSRFDASKE